MQTDPQHDEGAETDFGWWPEIVGAVGVLAQIWFMIYFADGLL